MSRMPDLSPIDRETVLAFAQCNMSATKAAKIVHRSRSGILYRLELVKLHTGLDPWDFFELGKLVEMARKGERPMN